MSERTFRVQSKGRVFKTNEQKRNRHTKEYLAACKIRGSSRWKNLSKSYKRRHPVCQWCLGYPSREVHHILPLTTHPKKAFKRSNLLAMCIGCHDAIHRKMNRGESLDAEIKSKKAQG